MQCIHHIFAAASARASPLDSHLVIGEWLIGWSLGQLHISPVRYQGTFTSQSALSLQTSHLEGHLHLQAGAESVSRHYWNWLNPRISILIIYMSLSVFCYYVCSNDSLQLKWVDNNSTPIVAAGVKIAIVSFQWTACLAYQEQWCHLHSLDLYMTEGEQPALKNL